MKDFQRDFPDLALSRHILFADPRTEELVRAAEPMWWRWTMRCATVRNNRCRRISARPSTWARTSADINRAKVWCAFTLMRTKSHQFPVPCQRIPAPAHG
jgi:hypothetical protein